MNRAPALIFALASLASPALADDVAWPAHEWDRADPEAAGFDVANLESALDFAGRRNSKAVVVVHRGKVVAERYWDGWDAKTTGPLHSATKSVMAILVGIAIDEGHIKGTDQPSADFLSEWQRSPHAEITVGHHLSMTTGLELGKPGRMIFRGALSGDERAFATSLDAEHPPGTVWGYHNPAYKLLFPLLEQATGVTLPTYAGQRLFSPLGIRSASFDRKRRGKRDYKTLRCSALDLARFGLLVLREGRWGEKQVVSAEFVRRATRPSQELNPSYGYLFWLNAGQAYRMPTTRYTEPATQGRLLPSCPPDVIGALGYNDQKCYVVPSLDLVVVRLGDAASKGGFAASAFDDPFLGQLCRASPGAKK